MVNTNSLIAASSFGTVFAIVFSVIAVLMFAIVIFLIWWVDVKKKTIKELGRAIRNATYNAFDRIHNLFTGNYVRTVYSDKSLNYSGTEFLPIPTKAPTKQYTYEFVGWDKNAVDEHGNAVVRAIYLQRVTKCQVNLYDDDKATLLKSFEIEYGAGINVSEIKPEKPDTKEFSYEFIGWDKDTNAFYQNENVCAVYKAIPKKYTYTFFDEDAKTIVAQGSALYGTPITAPTAPTKTASENEIYEFAGWKNYESGMLLTKDCDFYAVFTTKIVERTHASSVIKADGTIVRAYDIVEKSDVPEPKVVKSETAKFDRDEFIQGSVGMQMIKPTVQKIEPQKNEEVRQKIHLVSAKVAIDAEKVAEEKKQDETTKLEPVAKTLENPEDDVLRNLVVNKVRIAKKDDK